MTRQGLVMALMAAVLAMSPATARSGSGGTAFDGRWVVTGVAVADGGVQALADDDPAFMGRQLTFSSVRLAWDRPTATRDTCAHPRFERLRTAAPAALSPQLRKLGLPRPTGFAIRCRSGQWGPADKPVVFRGAGGVFALPWYDGGLLKLARR